MADGTSALQGHLVQGRSGSAGVAAVSLAEVRDFTLIQIAAWPNALAQVGSATAQAAGCAKAPGPRQVATGTVARLLRIEPLKWWLVASDGASATLDLLTETGSLLDLSQSRTWLRLSGPNAAVLLNHFLPLDLSGAAFPEGTVASSAFHHVGVTLWRDDRGFNLMVPRSFAASLYQILIESAAQYGLEIT